MYPQTRRKAVLVFLANLVTVTNLHAADEHAHRQYDAHVHGLASLTLAAEGQEVELVLSTPAANIVGFEHSPVSESENASVSRAKAALAAAQQLFGFPPAAACRTVHTDIQSGLFAKHEDEHSHDHGGHGTEASKSHPLEAGDHATEHVDIIAEYHFECAQPTELDRLHVLLFDTFPGIEHLEVQYIIGDRQGAAELTHASPVLIF